jgi:hypothetical protein
MSLSALGCNGRTPHARARDERCSSASGAAAPCAATAWLGRAPVPPRRRLGAGRVAWARRATAAARAPPAPPARRVTPKPPSHQAKVIACHPQAARTPSSTAASLQTLPRLRTRLCGGPLPSPAPAPARLRENIPHAAFASPLLFSGAFSRPCFPSPSSLLQTCRLLSCAPAANARTATQGPLRGAQPGR